MEDSERPAALNRALSDRGRGNHPCHLCDTASLPELSVLDHILVSYWEELNLDPELDYKKLMNLLEKLSLVTYLFHNDFYSKSCPPGLYRINFELCNYGNIVTL